VSPLRPRAQPTALLQRRSVRQLIKFSLVGVSSTAVDKGSLWLLLQGVLPGVPWAIGATLSYSLGVINGFLWNRHWTFRAREHGSVGEQFFRFLSTNVVGLLLNLGATRAVLSSRTPSDSPGRCSSCGRCPGARCYPPPCSTAGAM